MTNNSTIIHEEKRPKLDDLLHDYFLTEMPHPWPALRLPQTHNARRVGSFWSRYTGRVALAASIALLVAGYLTLADFFPQRMSPSGLQEMTPVMGNLDKGPRKNPLRNPLPLPTPAEETPDERPMPLGTISAQGKKSL